MAIKYFVITIAAFIPRKEAGPVTTLAKNVKNLNYKGKNLCMIYIPQESVFWVISLKNEELSKDVFLWSPRESHFWGCSG